MKTLSDIKKIAVLGAGTMGPGIAQTYAMGGYAVTMWTRSEETREKARASLRASLETFEAEGLLSESVGGSMPATAENLSFLVGKLPKGATWSVSGIGGRGHMPMMLAGLALGCDGLRVGLEDNIRYGTDERGNKIIATNLMLVERAVALSKLAGREIATADDAREILGITRHCLRDETTGPVTYTE